MNTKLTRFAAPLLLTVGFYSVTVMGCATSANVRAPEDFKLRDSTGVETRLRLDGYYYNVLDRYSRIHTGTAVLTVLLWGDGTFASIGDIGKEVVDSNVGPRHYGNLEQALEEVERFLSDPARLNPEGDQWRGANWGAFRVEGDSIVTQAFSPRPGAIPCCRHDVYEHSGRVLSDTSFVLDGFATYYFRSFEDKPPSANWTHTHPKLQ